MTEPEDLVHEAGHAAVALSLGVRVKRIKVRFAFEPPGMTTTNDLDEERIGPTATALIRAAGRAAVEAAGYDEHLASEGAHDDRRRVVDDLELGEDGWDRALAEARLIVRQPAVAAAIARIARELEERDELVAEDLERLWDATAGDNRGS